MKKLVNKRRLITILAMLLLLIILWTIWGNVTVGVTRYSVTSNKLPDYFDGFRIVVVSDLHNASFGSDNSQILRKIEGEQPDIIAITGDLIDSSKTDIETATALVHKLTQIAPCYYVTGNHEAWVGTKFKELEEKLIAESVQILRDKVIQLEKGNQTIQLAGLDDPDFTDRDSIVQQSMLQLKINQMDLTEEFCILLSHRPETFQAYVEEGVDLVLSGHAHGGQFRLPFIGGIVAPNQGMFPKYDAGIYTQNNTTMIVSRGIGNSIIPIRFNNRPELVSIELRCED